MNQSGYGNPYQQWMAWMVQRIQALEQRQQELEADNKRLAEQLAAIKPVQYGDITYKVQELHVNELSGVLNVGLTSLAEEGQLQELIGQMKMDHTESGKMAQMQAMAEQLQAQAEQMAGGGGHGGH